MNMYEGYCTSSIALAFEFESPFLVMDDLKAPLRANDPDRVEQRLRHIRKPGANY